MTTPTRTVTQLEVDGKPHTLIVLLGWYRAKPRHVEKIAQAYTSIPGVACLHTICPSFAVISPRLGKPLLKQFAIDVLRDVETTLDEYDGIQTIIFQACSNGGYFPLVRMYKMLSYASNSKKYSRIRERLAGTIHDSCPAYMNPTSMRKVMGFDDSSIIGKVIETVGGWVFEGDTIFNQWINFVPFPDLPELYLYSTGDDITLSDKVEEFVQGRQAKSIETISKNFHSSKHVGHFQSFFDEYMECVASFVQKCSEQASNAIHCTDK